MDAAIEDFETVDDANVVADSDVDVNDNNSNTDDTGNDSDNINDDTNTDMNNLSLSTDDEQSSFDDIEYNIEGMKEEHFSIDSNDFSLAISDKPNDGSSNNNSNDEVEGALDNMIAELTTVVNGRPQRSNAGQGVNRLEMSFTGKEYPAYQSKMFAMKRIDKNERLKARKNLMFTPQSIMKVIFTQMSAKCGIRKHGEKAIAAIFKELNQLDKGAKEGNPVVIPLDPYKLTTQEKREALEAVNLIKEKRCGKLKGRTCANGARQRRFIKEGDDFFLTHCIIGSHHINDDNRFARTTRCCYRRHSWGLSPCRDASS